MTKIVDFTAQKAACDFTTQIFYCSVHELNSNQPLVFQLHVFRDELDQYFLSHIRVDIDTIANIVARTLRADYSGVARILDGMETENIRRITNPDVLELKLNEYQFRKLLPEDCVPRDYFDIPHIEWGRIRWFKVGWDSVTQRCIPHVEKMVYTAVEYCAKEWGKPHKE